MLNVIIIDDERPCRQLLINLLNRHCSSVSVIAEANSVESAVIAIKEKRPHLIFLDIQMPKGTGFKLLEQFDDVFFDIIFVTSYDKYALNAIKFSALDYLIKPINIIELKKAVEKAELKLDKENKFIEYQNLLNNLKQNTDKKMIIHVNNKAVPIKMGDVAYIMADINYSVIHLKNKQEYVTAKTLKDMEEYVEELPNFIRINKSIVVNTTAILQYQKGDSYLVHLQNGEQFEISRRRRPEVLERLKSIH
jgi:two-component system LytT family response regulator